LRTLSKAVTTLGHGGKHLELPYDGLERLVTLRTNELVVVAGAPGGGKSMLSVNLAMDLNVPVLYFAQDSPNSILTRLAAIAGGLEFTRVADGMETDEGREWLAERLEAVRPTLIYNRDAVTFGEIEAKLFAMREWLGINPPLIIIDNLIDMIVEGSHPSETAFYAHALPRLKQLANKHDVSVCLLHHVKHGENETGTKPLKLSDLLFAGAREARHVWGVYRSIGNDYLNVQVLKQQDGEADAYGGLEARLRWYPKYARIQDD